MARMIILTVLLAAAVSAQQSKPFRYSGSYYGFFSGGACQHGFAVTGAGLGGEAFLYQGLSLGAEASYNKFTDGWKFGLVSLQTAYHFVPRHRFARWDPFITAGVGFGMVTMGGLAASSNAGGGFTYWFKPRIGLRVEFRSHLFVDEVLNTGRIGLTFR